MTPIRYAALALSGGLIALPAHAAPFAYGHFYLGDGGNPDILEYDASHRFVRSFEAALPPGRVSIKSTTCAGEPMAISSHGAASIRAADQGWASCRWRSR